MDAKLLISFTDQSASYVYGVEVGRILEKIERGDLEVKNNGFPVRLENKVNIENACKAFGYICLFGKTHFDEWIDFMGLKKFSNDC